MKKKGKSSVSKSKRRQTATAPIAIPTITKPEAKPKSKRKARENGKKEKWLMAAIVPGDNRYLLCARMLLCVLGELDALSHVLNGGGTVSDYRQRGRKAIQDMNKHFDAYDG